MCIPVTKASQRCHDSVQYEAAHLSARGDEDQDRLEGGVCLYGSVSRLVHGGHAGAVEFARVPLDVAL